MEFYNTTWNTSLENIQEYIESAGNDSRRTFSAEVDQYGNLQDVKRAVRNLLIPTICVFGIVGNMVNLGVLTRVRVRKADGGRDSGIHLGLIVLAVSDLLFCLTMFPRRFVPETKSLFEQKDFWCLYQLYGSGIVTTFILTSTWLTVIMAILRYIGICHPFASRSFDPSLVARVAYTFVFVVCSLVNIPSYCLYTLTEINIDNQTHHLVDIGLFDHKTTQGYVFIWCRMIFGIVFPVVILVFCNASLIRALRRSFRMRKRFHVRETVNASNRITLTLVIIIMLFVTLVVPSEAMDFFSDLIRLDAARTEVFLFVRAFANVLQIANFAFNFILYVTVNAHFRNILLDFVGCSHNVEDVRCKELVEYPMVKLTSNVRFSTSPSHLTETRINRLTTSQTSAGSECSKE